MTIHRRDFMKTSGCAAAALAISRGAHGATAATSKGPSSSQSTETGFIAIEEHLIVPSQQEHVVDSHPLKVKRELLVHYGEQRLADMDKAGIRIAVLSAFSEGLQAMDATYDLSNLDPKQVRARQTEAAVRWNDELHGIVQAHHERFRGFATLPMTAPDAAAAELRRCVEDLGFVGALLNGFDSSVNGTPNYYLAPEYDVLWAECVRLDRPLYIHPRLAAPDPFYSLPNCGALRESPWGFHESTARLVLALIVNGVFQRFPKLKIVLGHMGEIIPFWAWRIDHRLRHGARPELAMVQSTLAQNVFVTVSGFNNTPALQHLIAVMGADRVLYATDYPMEDATAAATWFDDATGELGLSPEAAAGIRAGNAGWLLGI